MLKKFLAFTLATLILISSFLYLGWHYLIPKEHVVFVDVYSYGIVSAEGIEKAENWRKFNFDYPANDELVLTFSPYRGENGYYNLKKVYVNGVDVTEEVDEDMKYKTIVEQKLSVVVYFEKGKAPAATKK